MSFYTFSGLTYSYCLLIIRYVSKYQIGVSTKWTHFVLGQNMVVSSFFLLFWQASLNKVSSSTHLDLLVVKSQFKPIPNSSTWFVSQGSYFLFFCPPPSRKSENHKTISIWEEKSVCSKYVESPCSFPTLNYKLEFKWQINDNHLQRKSCQVQRAQTKITTSQ